MRSPPPPAPQSAGPQVQAQGGGYGYNAQGFMGAGQFGGFINENTASMGVQMAEKYVVHLY